jgi:hypothetical protein
MAFVLQRPSSLRLGEVNHHIRLLAAPKAISYSPTILALAVIQQPASTNLYFEIVIPSAEALQATLFCADPSWVNILHIRMME